MKCSLRDSDLAGGEALTKARKPLDFGREDRVGILHLTLKPCQLKDSEPATQFPDRMLVVRSLVRINKNTITKQDRSLSRPR